MKCPVCGNDVENGKKFCSECGSPLQVKKLCPQCGAELKTSDKFCMECGAKITSDAQSGNQPIPPYTEAPASQRHGMHPALIVVIALASLFALAGLTYGIWYAFNHDKSHPSAVTEDEYYEESDSEAAEGSETSTQSATEAAGEYIKILSADDHGRRHAPEAGNSYAASNLIDDNLNTAWCYTLSSFDGDGPSFTLNARRIDAIEIINGYAKSQKSFYNNTRAGYITVYRTDYSATPREGEIIYSGSLDDTSSPQRFAVSNSFDNSRPTRNVAIRFKPYDSYQNNAGDYYFGDKWNDLSLTEFRLMGK